MRMDFQSCLLGFTTLFHTAQWGHDAMRSVEREKFINVGLFKYMEFWKQGIEQNATYVMKINPYVDY